MAAAFDGLAQQAYESEGLDREQDYAKGLLLEKCFVLDAQAVRAVGDAAGAKGPVFRIADTNFLSGVPGEDETLNCSLGANGPQFAVTAGTTLVEAAGEREQLGQGPEGVKELEGSAPGLDDADVVAVRGDGFARLTWVSVGFLVVVTGADKTLAGAKGFAALSAAVKGVERTLGA